MTPQEQATQIIAELVLAIGRSVAKQTFPGVKLPRSREFGMICGVIFLHELRGVPLTLSHLGRCTQIPRATLVRRVEQLKSRGMVERRGNHYRFIGALAPAHVRSLARAVVKAAEKLTVLDI